MKFKNRLWAPLLVLCLLLGLTPVCAAEEDNFPQVLARTKQGVVQIYGLQEVGRYWESWIGSGFAVGEEGKDSNVFLTNWHVVSGSEKGGTVRIWILQENCEISASSGEPDPDKSVECEVLKTTTGYPDYAIIRTKKSVSGYKPLPLLSSKQVQDGTTVYALGFPGVVGNASASHYGINDITSTNGIISQHLQMVDADNTWALMHTAKISGGNSGGPLITKDGAVVGLNTYAFGESENTADRYCAVYIDYAIEGLDALGLPYVLYGQSEPEATEATEPEESEQEDSKEEGTGIFVWIYLAAGLTAAGAAVVILLLKQKQRKAQLERMKEEEKPQQEKLRQQEQQQEKLRQQEHQSRKIVLSSPGGRKFELSGPSVTIGRDPGCTVVLPEKAAGVSRVHCRVEYQADRLMLTDLDSSYGTYVQGKRIQPNVPVELKAGSSFYLGSEKYTLTVC